MQSDFSKTYYELFALPQAYAVDVNELTERYRQLQRSVHPDKFADASDRDRRLSVQQASLINEAYQTLKDPLKRARYLLQLAGAEMDDESNTVMDTEFLMQQMALREELAEVRGAADPLAALDAFNREIASRLNHMRAELGELFDGEQADTETARILTLRMQFFQRLRDEALSLEEELVEAY